MATVQEDVPLRPRYRYWQYRCLKKWRKGLKSKLGETAVKSLGSGEIQKCFATNNKKKKNIKSNTVGSALLQVRGENWQKSQEPGLSKHVYQSVSYLWGFPPVQSNKTKPTVRERELWRQVSELRGGETSAQTPQTHPKITKQPPGLTLKKHRDKSRGRRALLLSRHRVSTWNVPSCAAVE